MGGRRHAAPTLGLAGCWEQVGRVYVSLPRVPRTSAKPEVADAAVRKDALDCSQQTAREIDGEVQKLLAECHAKDKNIQGAHQTELRRLVVELPKRKTLDGETLDKAVARECRGWKTPGRTLPGGG